MEKIFSVVLAAGEGKRMKSSKSKLLHKICGRTIVEWVLDAVAGARITSYNVCYTKLLRELPQNNTSIIL